jgi:thioredoxin-related protein
MKKWIFFIAAVLVMSFKPTENEQIKWMTWEQAIAASAKQQKKIFVDVYTDWCGWCKKMDETTFADPKVISYMNKNFYNVKFDAEQKANVLYNGHTLKFINQGRRGVHELAYSLLDGQLGYPSYVYLDEQQRRITISPGFKQVPDLLNELKFVAENHYKTTAYDAYLKKVQGQ